MSSSFTALLFAMLSMQLLKAEPIHAYQAVVIVPVADTLWKAAWKTGAKNIDECYATLPFSPEKPLESCLRFHQLKKHDIVTVIAEHGPELFCETAAFYAEIDGKKKRTFWMLKKHVVPVQQLHEAKVQLPKPIHLNKCPEEYNQNVLTLMRPWHDRVSNQLYSVGTRFKRCSKQDTEEGYAVYTLTQALEKRVSLVPKEMSRIAYVQNLKEAREQFIALLREWASLAIDEKKVKLSASGKQLKSCIPYVHGGCSLSTPIQAQGFYQSHQHNGGKKFCFWKRLGEHSAPLNGFDCSSMLLCAAHIIGLPYYCKNTSALVKSLKDVTKDEELEEGDLVWYKGHVLVVSDLKKNLLIEAAGYDKGYGKIHEIEISRVFKGIKNVEELKQSFYGNKTVQRLTSKGRSNGGPLKIKLLKLQF